MYKELSDTNHRPYPLPSSKWVMTQEWTDLLFMHWLLPADLLREHIPSVLEIDMFNGNAWIGILPFKVSRMRMRGLPVLPFFNSYLELNVRTYVRYQGIPGVYFFTLDANHPLVVTGAKTIFALPYRNAQMNYKREKKSIIYESKRIHPGVKKEGFQAAYTPVSEAFYTVPGTLDHWLTERYCLFTQRGKKIYRGDIHHTKWELYKAQADVNINSLASFLPRSHFNQAAVLHYSLSKKVFFWPLKRVL